MTPYKSTASEGAVMAYHRWGVLSRLFMLPVLLPPLCAHVDVLLLPFFTVLVFVICLYGYIKRWHQNRPYVLLQLFIMLSVLPVLLPLPCVPVVLRLLPFFTVLVFVICLYGYIKRWHQNSRWVVLLQLFMLPVLLPPQCLPVVLLLLPVITVLVFVIRPNGYIKRWLQKRWVVLLQLFMLPELLPPQCLLVVLLLLLFFTVLVFVICLYGYIKRWHQNRPGVLSRLFMLPVQLQPESLHSGPPAAAAVIAGYKTLHNAG